MITIKRLTTGTAIIIPIEKAKGSLVYNLLKNSLDNLRIPLNKLDRTEVAIVELLVNNYNENYKPLLCFVKIIVEKIPQIATIVSDENDLLELIDTNPNVIKYIKNPTNEMILKALEIDGMLLGWFDIRTVEMCEVAIKSDLRSKVYARVNERFIMQNKK